MKSNTVILKEILEIANTDLRGGSDMGYTMPDGKHHIYIYPDQEYAWNGTITDAFFVIEPNRVVDGAHVPMGDTYLTQTRDLSEVLIGCQWCLDAFDEDNRQQDREQASEANLPDELVVRMAHEAGWMEAEGKIELHSWEDLRAAIYEAICNYRKEHNERNPFSIEETIENILIGRFPSSEQHPQQYLKQIHILTCTQETDDGINTQVSLHSTQEEALVQAEALRRKDGYDERYWNFELSEATIDVSKFHSVIAKHSEKEIPDSYGHQTPSLESQIQAANAKLQTPASKPLERPQADRLR